jgi:hypothetical protein
LEHTENIETAECQVGEKHAIGVIGDIGRGEEGLETAEIIFDMALGVEDGHRHGDRVLTVEFAVLTDNKGEASD